MNYQTILTVLSISGIGFGIFNYFRNPQISLEKGEGLMAMSITQLQKDVTNIRDNHLHTMDVKIDDQGKSIRDLSIEVTKLSTIIDERIPRKI